MNSTKIIYNSGDTSLLESVLHVIGGVGALITVLTFLYLIIIQRKRDNTSQFESSLFNLLSLHNQIVVNLHYHDGKEITQGRAVFADAKTVALAMMNSAHSIRSVNVTIGYVVKSIDEARQALKDEYYGRYYQQFESNLNHYFRNLYHIFLYIDETKLISNNIKSKYIRIVRAQLSQDELFIIMLNSMFLEYGYPNFFNLIIKYKLLENFRNKEVKPHEFYQLYREMVEATISGKLVNGIPGEN